MYKIYKLCTNQPVDFAAEELKKYLRMMMPDCGEIEIVYDPAAKDGFRLGLLEQFGLPNEAEDPILDDVVHVETTAGGGIIAGSNPRSVLFAVYRLLKENGCRFLFPGTDGEYIPRKPVEAVSYHKMADHRLRAHTTEGDPSLEQALQYIDYQTKNDMNGYGLYQIYDYHHRYYDHQHNESNRPPEPVSFSLVEQWNALCEAELTKRGINIFEGCHGWVNQVAGIPCSDRMAYKTGKKELTEEIRSCLAMMNGKRDLVRKDIDFTNICMSRADLRKKFGQIVADAVEQNPQVTQYGVTLADTSHNHCECPECQKLPPSDYYVMILNEIDEELTRRGLNTKIQFSAYVDCQFPPIQEKLNNPDRFVLTYCPISRDYTYSITEETPIPEAQKYKRNAWDVPKSTEEAFSFIRAWQKTYPGDCMVYEYHFWLHQYRDLGGMQFARRVYEDVHAYKPLGMSGCIEDGSNKSFFPNGFADYIYCATLFDRELDYDAVQEDYFKHIYGTDWKIAKDYLQKITNAFEHTYMCGKRSADPDRGEHYNPEHVADLERVKEITAQMREQLKSRMAMPTRPQTVCWRLLLRHTQWCDQLAEVFIAKCKGYNKYARELFDAFAADFGKYDFEMERYFDFGLAVSSLLNIINKRPKIEL